MSDTINSLLFENLTLLLLTEFVALAIVLAIHRRKFTAKSRRAVWITLGFCGFLIFVQHWVQTDTEKLKATTETLALAVDRADLQTIEQHLDKNFQSEQDYDKDSFMEQVEQVLQRYQVDEANVWQYGNIEIDNDKATVVFQVFCDIKGSRFDQRNFPSKWRLHYVRRNEEWKVEEITPLKYGPYDAERVDILH